MFRCFFGKKEKVNPNSTSPQEELERRIVTEFRPVLNPGEIEKNNAFLAGVAKEAERKKQESREAESQQVRDIMLDYIQYPHKYTTDELRIEFTGGFEVDFVPLIDVVNKCPGVRLKMADIKPFGMRYYYKLVRHISPIEVKYVIV